MLYISQTMKGFRGPLAVQGEGPSSSEMEFLDINLTKDSSLLRHAIQYLQSLLLAKLKENHNLLWFLKSLQKNPRNKKTRAYS